MSKRNFWEKKFDILRLSYFNLYSLKEASVILKRWRLNDLLFLLNNYKKVKAMLFSTAASDRVDIFSLK